MPRSEALGNDEIVIAAKLGRENSRGQFRHIECARRLAERSVHPEARFERERQFDRHQRIKPDFRQRLRTAHVISRQSQNAREFFDHDVGDRAPRALWG